MKLSGLHILLTFQCTYECDHCFVWGSPRQHGVLSIEQVEAVLDQAKEAGVESVYFEGGEPFLYYAVLARGVQKAAEMGFSVGIVSNAYWATTVQDAVEWLRPLAGRLADFTVSSDLFHCDKLMGAAPENALAAAKLLDIPTGLISIAQPDEEAPQTRGQILDQGAVMFRGRAAVVLSPLVEQHDWEGFTQCAHEDLAEPGRLHLDPLGNLHICQGIVIGNLFEKRLKEICASYVPEQHPVCGPLLEGGPAALVEEFHVPHLQAYADACHLCYDARLGMRQHFLEILGPDQMYGVLR